jgi:hypothetical protein
MAVVVMVVTMAMVMMVAFVPAMLMVVRRNTGCSALQTCIRYPVRFVAQAFDFGTYCVKVGAAIVHGRHGSGHDGDLYILNAGHAANRRIDLGCATGAIHASDAIAGLAVFASHFDRLLIIV